jgi:hypothetical protein
MYQALLAQSGLMKVLSLVAGPAIAGVVAIMLAHASATMAVSLLEVFIVLFFLSDYLVI